MDADQVARTRLRRLGLTGPPAGSVREAVDRLVAVQAQDYAPAGWSLAQRVPGLTQDGVDRLVTDGELVRTHALRPTWHLVLADQLAPLQRLTAARVVAGCRPRWHRLGLDQPLLDRCGEAIRAALADAGRLTRPQLGRLLEDAGLVPAGPTEAGSLAGHVLMHAELTGLIGSGGPIGRQQSYLLLDGRLPRPAPDWPDDEDAGLAELAARFFAGHGPATEQDFRWWASLTLAQVRRALAAAGDRLRQDELDELGGRPCWLAADATVPRAAPSVLLLQAYDEYTVAYPDTRYVLDRTGLLPELPAGRAVYNLVVLVDGRLAGHWKRTLTRDRVLLEVLLYAPLGDRHHRLLEQQAQAHGRYVGLPPDLAVRVDRRLDDSFTRRSGSPARPARSG